MNYDGPRDGNGNAGDSNPGDVPAVILTAEPGKDLLIPDGGWILGGEYIRQGSDLIIKGADGQMVVVRDFFSLASAPDLYTDTGAVINLSLIHI